MNPDVSRRIAKALAPLKIESKHRFMIGLKSEKARSFETLPNWVKEIVYFGERNGQKADMSVDLPEAFARSIPKK